MTDDEGLRFLLTTRRGPAYPMERRSLPRRAILSENPVGRVIVPPFHVHIARVQGERTRVDGQHEPRDRTFNVRATLLGGRTTRESSIGFSSETEGPR